MIWNSYWLLPISTVIPHTTSRDSPQDTHILPLRTLSDLLLHAQLRPLTNLSDYITHSICTYKTAVSVCVCLSVCLCYFLCYLITPKRKDVRDPRVQTPWIRVSQSINQSINIRLIKVVRRNLKQLKYWVNSHGQLDMWTFSKKRKLRPLSLTNRHWSERVRARRAGMAHFRLWRGTGCPERWAGPTVVRTAMSHDSFTHRSSSTGCGKIK